MPQAGFEPATPACKRSHNTPLHNTKVTLQTNILDFSGNRTRDPSKQKAADLRLRQHSQWGRLIVSANSPSPKSVLAALKHYKYQLLL